MGCGPEDVCLTSHARYLRLLRRCIFPTSDLRQAMEQLDLGFLGSNGMVAGERHTRIVEVLQRAIDRKLDAPMRAFSIFHGARDGEFMQSRFCLWETQYSAAVNRWTDRKHNLVAENSYLAIVDGSGRNVVENTGREWIGSDAGRHQPRCDLGVLRCVSLRQRSV